MASSARGRSDEPFLLLKKFTPSYLFPEDRDDDTRRAVLTSKQENPRSVPLYNGINGIRYLPNDLVMREYTYAHVYPSRRVLECPLPASLLSLSDLRSPLLSYSPSKVHNRGEPYLLSLP